MPVWDFPNPPFGKEICHHSKWDQITQVEESAGSAIRRYKYPPGRPGCNPWGDRSKKIIIYNVFDG